MSNPHAELIEKLNKALAWELRASIMYSHFAAYVQGINRLHLKPYFEAEAAESQLHGGEVRTALVKLKGVATTVPDTTRIPHTTDYRVMLKEAYSTEKVAAETYETILRDLEFDAELYDAMQQIYFSEMRSVEELTQLVE